MSELDWQETLAAVWRPNQRVLRPVRHIDGVQLDQLIGIDHQKAALINNTRRFLAGQPCNNALLWGSRGTGKSSLIKAVFNHFSTDKLRLVEVFKDDLHFLHDIVDLIRDQPFNYLVYCDDLAFSIGDHSYSVLKTVLEGSIEAAPDNVLLYATSNRRHLVPQTMKENLDSKVIDGELHLSDAIEEKIALSDRFGLWLSFHPISQAQYLEIVDGLFHQFKGDREDLHRAALRFSAERASRSGRTARQFFNSYVADE